MPDRHWIYFVEAKGQAIKIGMAGDLSKRIASLQCGNHLTLSLRVAYEVRNARDMESRHHLMFAASRLAGEWFAITPDLERHVKRILDGDRPYIAEWCGTGRVRSPEGIERYEVFSPNWGEMSVETQAAFEAGVRHQIGLVNEARGIAFGDAP